jgi:hypothetical protein
VPGPGTWCLAVWLTNAAGNGTPANAAHAILTVTAGTPGGGGPGSGSTTLKATIRVSETLRGRELVVHVSGSASGTVRVGFTGRLAGRIVASGAETVALKRGRLTATFKLGPRTAAHATIRVSAKLGHEIAVSSTLRRHPRHARAATAGLLALPTAAMAVDEGTLPPVLEVSTTSRYEAVSPSEVGRTELHITATAAARPAASSKPRYPPYA